MPSVKSLSTKLKRFLVKHQLERKFAKQLAFFILNPEHPSLHTEILEPHAKDIYSFRIDRSYRAIFIFVESDTIEIIAINKHYND